MERESGLAVARCAGSVGQSNLAKNWGNSTMLERHQPRPYNDVPKEPIGNRKLNNLT